MRRGPGRRPFASGDVRREIESHLDMRARELEAEGMSPEDARAEALRVFGDPERVERDCAAEIAGHGFAEGRGSILESITQDVRFAARSLARSPMFTTVALVTLALGIGANAAVFSVVRGVLLAPLDFEEPDRLVSVTEVNQQGGDMALAWPNYRDWHATATGFEALAAYRVGASLVLGADRPLRTGVAFVTEDYWDVFPTEPVAGRLTTTRDHRLGAAPAAVISESFWRTELSGRGLDAITLEVAALSVQVVGVIPDGRTFPQDVSIWIPGELDPGSQSRDAHSWWGLARLAPGATIERVDAEMDALTEAMLAPIPGDREYLAAGVHVQSLRELMVGDARRPLMLLFAAAGFVLLVACTNLASTLLARGSGRRRELAVRASLGAPRGRIVRQLLTESAVLATLGAGAGLAVATVVVRVLKAVGPASVPRVQAVGFDGWVLAFTGLAAIVTTAVFGLLPASRLSAGSAADLHEGARGSVGRGPLWRVLVGTEVALALVLMVGSGLLVRSFRAILAEDRGFDGSDVLSVDLELSRQKHPTPLAHSQVISELIEAVSSIPGVASVGVGSSVPLLGFLSNGRVELDGDPGKFADASYVAASAGYFESLDIELLAGRLFAASDGPDDAHVAIVNRAFADAYWPDANAVGRSVTGGGMDDLWQERPFARVVGVVDDVRYRDLSRPPPPTVYFPSTQRPFRLVYSAYLTVESATGDAPALAAAVRDVGRRVDADASLEMRLMDEAVGGSMAGRRFAMLVLGSFAAIALVLAAVGIYGVVAYSVARRTREMGIRLALGAPPRGVRRLVMKEALSMVVGGLGVGVVLAWLAGRVMQSLLYEVSAVDPLTFTAVAVAVVGVALAASWIPARASTRVNPRVTMRAE